MALRRAGMARWAGSSSAITSGRGKSVGQPAVGLRQRRPCGGDEAGGVGASARHRHLLAENGAHGELGTVDVTRRPAPGRLGDSGARSASRPRSSATATGSASRSSRRRARCTAVARSRKSWSRERAADVVWLGHELDDRWAVGERAACAGTHRPPPPRYRARREGRGRPGCRRRRTARRTGSRKEIHPPVAGPGPLASAGMVGRAVRAFRRSSVGVLANTSRTVSLNCRMLAKPAPNVDLGERVGRWSR